MLDAPLPPDPYIYMIVVLSPAKSLDFEAVDESVASSTPIGINDADYLIEELQKLSPAKVKTLLGTSDSLTRCRSDVLKIFRREE